MFELIAGYKGLVISLILSTGNILKVETHNLDCAVWWNKYVITHERKYPLPWQNHFFHTYNSEVVVGYHCSDKEPT
jgi:hypothetical protein